MKVINCPPYLQHRERSGLRGRGPLELGQPVPSLSGVPAEFVEESPDVVVNQIAVVRRVPVRGGHTPHGVLLLLLMRDPRRVRGHVGAHHAASRSERAPLPLVGTPGQGRWGRHRQVLSSQDNGPAAGGAAAQFSHVEAFQPWGPDADWLLRCEICSDTRKWVSRYWLRGTDGRGVIWRTENPISYFGSNKSRLKRFFFLEQPAQCLVCTWNLVLLIFF